MRECRSKLTLIPPLHRALGGVMLYFEDRCQSRNIGSAEGQLLCVMSYDDECAVGSLADSLSIKPSTLSSMLNRLTERKLILRRKDPEDRRSSIIRLTRKGRELADWLQEAGLKLEEEIRSKVSPAALKGFSSVVEAIEGCSTVEKVEERGSRPPRRASV